MKMRPRRIIIGVGCVVSFTLALMLLRPHDREPQYNGVPLATWLEKYHWRDPEFSRAIKHMGTNAVPFLIQSVQYEEPGWRTWLAHTSSKWPAGALNSGPARWLLGEKAVARAGASVFAFGILGPDADPALGELRRIQQTSKDASTSERARECIEFITERIRIGFDQAPSQSP
jgi:hypothetical protein